MINVFHCNLLCTWSFVKHVNNVQVLYSDNSIALCAPTGSGKTVAFELAIVRLLVNSTSTSNLKIIYSEFQM